MGIKSSFMSGNGHYRINVGIVSEKRVPILAQKRKKVLKLHFGLKMVRVLRSGLHYIKEKF